MNRNAIPGPVFYEFFAGGGMARLGLGGAWTCAFANDFDRARPTGAHGTLDTTKSVAGSDLRRE